MSDFRCRHGWHSWRFLAMSDRRMVTVPPYSTWVCTLVDECRRCGLIRTMDSTPIPKRLKS